MLAGWDFSVLFDDHHTGTLHFNTGRVGAPDLPTASALIHLPAGSQLTVDDMETAEYRWKGMVPPDFPLAPVIEGWAKDQGWPGYEPDKKIYATDAFYRGGDPIEIEDLGVMGGEQLFRLTLHPVAYNPVSGDIVVDTLLIATLASMPSTTHSPFSAPRYLIVSRPQFREGLQPFVQWKRQEGFELKELYVETDNRDSIKDLVARQWPVANGGRPWPDYMLLVGDASQIQPFPGNTSLNGETHVTDLYYADFTGDYLPEAMLGRWPVGDTAELRAVVEKSLRYERFLDVDTLQLKRMMLVAGEESSLPAPTTTNGQVNYLKREVSLAHPDFDTLCYYNPASGGQLGDIVADLGSGVGLLSYTAHCTVGGWTAPAMNISGVASAATSQPAVYVNNCCKSNDFTGTCFGEQLLLLPQGGAVGVVGATNSTLWNEDFYWAVGPKTPVVSGPAFDSCRPGAFDGLVGRLSTVATLGDLLWAGNLSVTAFGSTYSRFYWEVYCLFGDPALQPWIGVPQPVELHLAEALVNGRSEVAVNGTPGARVTVVQDGAMLGMADIGADSTAVVELHRTLDTLPVLITATGRRLRPRVDTFAVETMVVRGVTLRNVTVGDTAVHCIVENVGQQRYDSLRVVLGQSVDQHDGARLEEQVVLIDSLLPREWRSATLPVTVAAIGQIPLWKATLSVWSDSMECRLKIEQPLTVEYPDFSLRILNVDSSVVSTIQPNATYLLQVLPEGPFDSLEACIVASPSGDTLISINSHLVFPAAPFYTRDSLCALHVGGTLYWQEWRGRVDYWLEPGNRVDAFNRAFDGHPWRNDSPVPWRIDSTAGRGISLRSGAIGDGQNSSLCIDVLLDKADSVAFWVKTSTEPQYDKFTFYVDGRRKLPEAWGSTEWNRRSHALDAGRHTLCWTYSKDQSNSEDDDCVWIDDVQLPLALWDSLYAWDCAAAGVGIDHSPLSVSHPSLKIYPNPAVEEVWMEAEKPTTIVIHDALGRVVASFELPAGSPVRWDVGRLPSGFYLVTGSDESYTQRSKIIIRKK